MLTVIAVMLLSYLAGSIPTSIIVSKLTKGIDIRNYGSGNAGGTNTFRVLGWKAGVLVSLVDVGKGTFATLVISSLRIDPLPFSSASLLLILAGLSAVLGHTFTIFAGFKGGKGVGTGAGMIIGLYPLAFLLCLIIFALVLFSTGLVSVASMSAAVGLPVVLCGMRWLFNQPVDSALLIFSLIIPFFIIYTHRSNILRLLAGEEIPFEKIAIFRRKKIK
jgi:glycerol-3-phosphate acyltransferase PlsY